MLKNFFIRLKIKRMISFGISSTGGRNFLGRICVHHKGNGNKRIYKFLDFFRRLNCFGIIVNIWKDSFRSGYIACVFYQNGLISNIIATELVGLGKTIFSGDILINNKCFNLGSAIPLKDITLFTVISNIEMFPLSHSILSRAAGVGSILIGLNTKQALLKLKSGWQLSVDNYSLATIGFVSNCKHKYIIIRKAGMNRNLGIRPTVRGVAKNPCDHPHGGGEGKKSPPSAQMSPWGKFTKGTPTKNKQIDRINRRLFKKFLS